jgi:hypothetical protein
VVAVLDAPANWPDEAVGPGTVGATAGGAQASAARKERATKEGAERRGRVTKSFIGW